MGHHIWLQPNTHGVVRTQHVGITDTRHTLDFRDQVNLRVIPSTEAEVIATVDTDTQLPLIETVTDEDEFTWYKVSYEEAEAYVRSDMAEVVETEEQGTEN